MRFLNTFAVYMMRHHHFECAMSCVRKDIIMSDDADTTQMSSTALSHIWQTLLWLCKQMVCPKMITGGTSHLKFIKLIVSNCIGIMDSSAFVILDFIQNKLISMVPYGWKNLGIIF